MQDVCQFIRLQRVLAATAYRFSRRQHGPESSMAASELVGRQILRLSGLNAKMTMW